MIRLGVRIFTVLVFFALIVFLSIFGFGNETMNYFMCPMFMFFVIILWADIDSMHVCTKIATNFERECKALKEKEQKAVNEGQNGELESIEKEKNKMKEVGDILINSDTALFRFPYKGKIRKIIDRL